MSPVSADCLRALEHARTQALVARDMALAWQLHAPEYQLITPSGVTFSRDRYLRMIEAGDLAYIRWTAGPMAVRVGEKMALIRYLATLALDAGNGQGTPFDCWHTDSYELIGARWQAVWSQATAVRTPHAASG